MVPAPFPLGVVSDEVDQDLEQVCQVAVDLGMQVLELNTVWGMPADRLAPDDVRRAHDLLRRHTLRLDAVSTLAFKALELSKEPDLEHSPVFAEHMAAIQRAARIARTLADVSITPSVRIFAFRREPMAGLGNPSPILPDGGGIPDSVLLRIVHGLRLACDLARDEGVHLLLENVRSCWNNTGVNSARIVELTNRAELSILWDPANDFVSSGLPFATGYTAVKPYIAAVHCKDARIVDPATGLTAWMPIGQGDADMPGQIATLLDDGFTGPVLLETHWRGDGLTREASSRYSFAGLQATLAQRQAGAH
jgi:sugar phosphate isomerase/epimerase